MVICLPLSLCLSVCFSVSVSLCPSVPLCVSVCLSLCTDTCKNMCTHPFAHIQRPKHNVGVFLYHTAHCDEAGSLPKPEPHHLGSACWPATLSIHPSLLSSRTAGMFGFLHGLVGFQVQVLMSAEKTLLLIQPSL